MRVIIRILFCLILITRAYCDSEEKISTFPEIESDGLRDCRLAIYIKDRIRSLQKEGKARQANALKKQFDAIMFSVVPYKWGYNMDPDKWADARHQLYELANKTEIQ